MKITFRPLATAACVMALATLTACVAPAPMYQTSRYPYVPPQPAAYPYPQQQRGAYVEYGRIANIEVVRSESQGTAPSGGGAILGGVIGAVVGNQFGRGNGRAAATALGAVGGALVGNNVEGRNNAPRVAESFRISIETEQGGYRAFDVPSPGDLRPGDRVRIDNGHISRI